MKLKKLNRILLYVFIMGTALTLLYRLDTSWSMRVDTDVVVVAAHQILPHESITEEDIQLVRMKEAYIIDGALQDANLVIGQEALQLIEAGDQLTQNRIDKTALLGDPDAHIVEMPDAWILSVPGSLRRLDRIAIFAVAKDEQTVSPETGEAIASPAHSEKVLDNIIVAYYKDTSSNEVQSTEETNPNVRVDATTRGKKLELQLTDAELSRLTELANQGYQFMVGYGS